MLALRQGLSVLQAARALSSAAAQADLWPTAITIRGGKSLEVEFNTGERFSLPAEYLRVESPAAEARDAAGRSKVVHGRRFVQIMGAEPIGSYAVRLSFDDLHRTGIYTWQLLHELGTAKTSRMRAYLRLLRERGLSRDPPALRKRRQKQQGQEGSGGGDGGGDGVSATSSTAAGSGGSSTAAGSQAGGSNSGSGEGGRAAGASGGRDGRQPGSGSAAPG